MVKIRWRKKSDFRLKSKRKKIKKDGQNSVEKKIPTPVLINHF